MHRRAVLMGLLATAPAVPAAPVNDALSRPAVTVRQPARAVLLSAALAGERIVAVGERGLIVLSDDHGRSWRQAPSPVSVSLTMVRFADAQHGVAVGHGGTVLSTADGGASWTPRLDGRRAAGLALAQAVSPQAQRDAQRLVDDGPDKPLLDLLMWDDKRWLVVGAYGLAFHTADAGATWTSWMERLPNPRALHWYVIRRTGNTLMAAGEQGLLARSDDGGASFRALPSPYKGSWFAGEIGADGHWLLAGLRGNVWRSPDGESAWVQLPLPQPSTVNAVLPQDAGRVLLATQAGLVLQLQGDGVRPLNPGQPLPLPAALLAGGDGSVLSFGVAGVVPLAPTKNPPGGP